MIPCCQKKSLNDNKGVSSGFIPGLNLTNFPVTSYNTKIPTMDISREPLSDTEVLELKRNAALDAFNASYHVARPKARTEFGLRQFGDVIGRARSTLNVIDVWKSKLVSASASAVARQLSSSGGAGDQKTTTTTATTAVGAKNKNKSVCSPMGTAAGAAGGGAGAKNEISSMFSSVAAASRIKRRLFKRNKSLDLDVIAPPAVSVENPVVEPDLKGVLGRSVDNILDAIVTDGEVQQCDKEVHSCKARRRSSASILIPGSDRRAKRPTTTRNRCQSYNEPSGTRVTKEQLDGAQVSEDDSVEDDKFGGEGALNNKLAKRSCGGVRERSKRSLGTRVEKHHHHLRRVPFYSHGDSFVPIVLLDQDFDLDDFYYYYWRKKLSGRRDSRYKKRGRRRERSLDDHSTDTKVIRAKLKLKKVPTEAVRDQDQLHGRRLSDSALSTALESSTTIVEELDSSTTAPSVTSSASSTPVEMMTENDSSTATAVSTLSVPGKPRKKLSFMEPTRRRGGRGGGGEDTVIENSLPPHSRPRSGSLDSELEVLAQQVEWSGWSLADYQWLLFKFLCCR